MLLAAGFGQRLRPLSLLRPKPLFPVLNRSMLSHWLGRLWQAGVKRVVVNAHYLADELLVALAQQRSVFGSLEIIHSPESEILGTGGGLKQAADFFDRPFFVVNADIHTDIDLKLLAEAHLADVIRPPATIALIDRPAKATVSIGAGDQIIGFRSPRPLPGEIKKLCGAGLMVLEPRVLTALPDGFSDIIEQLANFFPHGPAGYFCPGAAWTDMGTAEDYLALNRLLAQGGKFWGGVLVEGSGKQPEGAFGQGFVIAEEGARISLGAKICDCVLWKEASIGAGAWVTGAVVAGTVKPGAVIRGGVVVG
jgi:mannose-1-phosphate guanylyltransferase